MDKSEKFVKMCSQAKEIQELWSHSSRNSGDWYFNIPLNAVYPVSFEYQKDADCIWIPRQDQLQEMWTEHRNNFGFKKANPTIIINNLFFSQKIITNNYPHQTNIIIDSFQSMEQMLLAIVMREKYNKIWDFKTEQWIDLNTITLGSIESELTSI